MKAKVQVLLLLAALVAAPAAFAGEKKSLAAGFWEQITLLLDAGCAMDPNGNGSGLDPSGACALFAGGDEGSQLDPNGLDSGSGIDPNGFGVVKADEGSGLDPYGRGFSIDPNGLDSGTSLDPSGGPKP